MSGWKENFLLTHNPAFTQGCSLYIYTTKKKKKKSDPKIMSKDILIWKVQMVINIFYRGKPLETKSQDISPDKILSNTKTVQNKIRKLI